MNKIRYVLAGLLVFAGVSLCAQNYCGKAVRQTDQSPLESATVCLLSADSAILRFAYTNQDGRFCLAAHSDAAYVSVSHIGFAPVSIPLPAWKEGADIELAPANIEIREVKIVSRRLRMTGDTLAYSMAGFKTPQDRSVCDVLERIPGIQVAQSGAISYQGEAINKFYIEGIDLLGDNYALASNNLQANYVEEIQILENHEPIKSLAGKTFSEQAAVNLILKEEAKAQWLGHLDLGAGAVPFKWNNRILGSVFNKKGQQMNLYKNDNTGEDLSRELRPAINVENIMQGTQNADVLRSLLSPASSSNPPVDARRYRMNEEHLLSTNQLYKLGENDQLRFQFSYLNSVQKRENYSLWTYYPLPDSSFQIREENRQTQRRHQIQGEINYTQNKARSYLSNALKIRQEFDTNESQLFANHVPVSQEFSMPFSRVENEFKWIIPQAKSRWELTSSMLFNHAPEQLRIDSVQQNVHIRDFIMRHAVKHAFPAGIFQIGQKLGLDYTYQELYASHTFPPLPGSVPDNDNDPVHFGLLNMYYEPQLLLRANHFRVVASAHFSLRRYRLESQSKSEIMVLPKINATYETGWWTWKMGVDVSRRAYYIQSLHPSWIWRNYRTIQAGNDVFSALPAPSYTASISYRNPIRSLFLSFSANYRTNPMKQILQTSYIDRLITMSQYIDYTHRTNSSSYAVQFSKTFITWNTRLFMDLMHLKSESHQLVGSVFSSYINQNNSVTGRVYVQPQKWFNCQYELAISGNRFRMLQPQAQDYPATHYWRHNIDSWFFLGKSWQAGLDQTFYHGTAMQENVYFIDAKIRLKIQNKEISFVVSNLLNTKYLFYQTYQTYQNYQMRYPLSGRYVFVAFSFALP
jgi:hypothetical protein